MRAISQEMSNIAILGMCSERAASPMGVNIWFLEVLSADVMTPSDSLQWRHNGRDGISTHQPHHCLLNRLLRRTSKKTSKLRVTGLCAVNSPVTGEFQHKWLVTWKMFPFDDVIMLTKYTKLIQKNVGKDNQLLEKKTALHVPTNIMMTSLQKELIWKIWWDRMIIYHKS